MSVNKVRVVLLCLRDKWSCLRLILTQAVLHGGTNIYLSRLYFNYALVVLAGVGGELVAVGLATSSGQQLRLRYVFV